MASVEERIAELTKGMLRKKFFAVLSNPAVLSDKFKATLPEHLEYMISLEKSGVLFASGPFTEIDGTQRGQGLTILRVKSADEARRIAERDPFVVAGLRTFQIREWTVMEGSLAVTVNFSDRTMDVS
jgi:uncharacterized protein YciI